MNYQPREEPRAATVGNVRVERLGTLADLQAHRDAWSALASGAPVAHKPAYVEAAWNSGLCAGDLLILMAYQGDQLVAVWPLYTSRKMSCTTVRHVGNGGREEYAGPLLAPDMDPEPILAALWDAARREGDLIELYNLDADGPADRFFRQVPASGRIVGAIVCPITHMNGVVWDAWFATKSKNFRSDLKRKRKRLESAGALAFRRVPAADAEPFARWCVEVKRLWLDAHKIGESWLRPDEIISFYGGLMDRDAGVEGFALELDGQVIAGVICLLGGGICEYYLTVYDERFRDGSPGNLLIEDLSKWCAQRGLDLDFRFPSYDYKERWSDGHRTVNTIVLALSPAGSLMLAGRRAQRLVRRARSAIKKIALLAKERIRPSSKPQPAHGQGHT